MRGRCSTHWPGHAQKLKANGRSSHNVGDSKEELNLAVINEAQVVSALAT